MQGTSDELSLVSIKGTAEDAGAQYGAIFRERIHAFATQEVQPSATRDTWSRQFASVSGEYAPNAMHFLKGLAKGARLELETALLLSLHEELVHVSAVPTSSTKPLGHCTSIAIAAPYARAGEALNCMTWDWEASKFPWPGLLQLSIDGKPRSLCYHFPGMWNCCGLNEAGLSLMWTGTGYWPTVPPELGVPTYLLIAELMLLTSVEECLEYLKKVPRAGSFNFSLVDSTGKIAAVEALPHALHVSMNSSCLYRANLYCTEEIAAAAGQSAWETLPPDDYHSAKRLEFLERTVTKWKGRDRKDLEKLLSEPPIFINDNFGVWTLDRFIADCKERTLWTCRFSFEPKEWSCFSL